MEEPQLQNQQPIISSSMAPSGNKRGLKLIGIILALIILGLGLFLLINSQSKESSNKTPELSASSIIEPAEVTITKDGFSPTSIRVKRGQNVIWKNLDDALHQIAADPHPNHTSVPDLLSDPLNKNETFSFSFEKSGTYTYHDEIDPLKFLGTIIVE